MTTANFITGDTVLVYRDHHDKAPYTATVSHTSTRTVTLDDGQRFTSDGREWGNSDAWRHRYIKLAPAVDEANAAVPAPAPTPPTVTKPTEIVSFQCPNCRQLIAVEGKDIHLCTTRIKVKGKTYVSREYVGYYDGMLICGKPSHHEVEIVLDRHAMELIESGMTASVEALDGGDPEHVELIDPDQHQAQTAADMGYVYVEERQDGAKKLAAQKGQLHGEYSRDLVRAREESDGCTLSHALHGRARIRGLPELGEVTDRYQSRADGKWYYAVRSELTGTTLYDVTDADLVDRPDDTSAPATPQTLPEAIALALTGTADPVCEHCGATAFVSCGGHLYCKGQWQQGVCKSLSPETSAPAAVEEGCEYKAFIAADKAWSAELKRIFGKRAGDARYIAEGRTGHVLSPLHAEFARARDAWYAKQEAVRSIPTEPPARIAGHMTCECAMCYSLQWCIWDGVIWLCVDAAACIRRQEENRNPTPHMPDELISLRAKYQQAVTDGQLVIAESLVSHAMCQAEAFVRGAVEPATPSTRPAALAQMTARVLDSIAI